MKAHLALRAATRARHDQVDAAFSRFDLGSASGYRVFLRAQAAAHLPAEDAIDAADGAAVLADWPVRRRAPLLCADLADLDLAAPPGLPAPALHGEAAVLGAIYVLQSPAQDGEGITALAPAAALRRLQRNAYRPRLIKRLGQTARYFAANARIVQHAGVYVIDRERDLSRLMATAAMIEGHWRRIGLAAP